MKTMTKILSLAFATAMAFCTVSCSSDDNATSTAQVKENIVSEYHFNDSLVLATKTASKNKNAILLIAFGSTWTNAFEAFDKTVEAYKAAFPGYDVFLSYSSDICINRASAAEHGVTRNYYEPRYLLHAIGSSKYDEIRVQSLQVIPGEEFSNVVAAVKKFMNNGYIESAHLDDEYLKELNDNEKIYFGMPLLYSNTGTGDANDIETVASALNGVFSTYAQQGVVAFMGHGNPDTYDTFKANVRYSELETALQTINRNYFVGTVDMSGNKKNDVLDRIKNQLSPVPSTVTFQALMSIAGDHAHNDMIGGNENGKADDEYRNSSIYQSWLQSPEEYDEAFEGFSWYKYFANVGGFTTLNCKINNNAEPVGLLELPTIRQIWINHTKNAQPFMDAYHSMYPEE